MCHESEDGDGDVDIWALVNVLYCNHGNMETHVSTSPVSFIYEDEAEFSLKSSNPLHSSVSRRS